MTEALVSYLSNLENIQFEEFYDFFCLDLSSKSKEILHNDYQNLRGSNKDVSFDDIARFYCENYKEIIDILELLDVAKTRIDEFLAKRYSANRQNYPKELIEKLLFHDIENKTRTIFNSISKTRTIFNSISKLTNRYDSVLNSFVNEVELSTKLEDLLGT
eukprot:CAMPEP_0176474410 /NCGR_PEP_ID=MMETSP0127-20121128/42966_1 /TAXON_ID=938130 /ORGANISM="Platyophrya macrostoma, Strain WH" /LENGTH=159 /DNA_ID=CAMNT_0017869753 /DNA_START=34 /DNA_END=510 /DNA_ORIENTATION=+